MPSEEYCANLLEQENEALEAAQEALDDYNEALDDLRQAAAEEGGSYVKAGGHGLSGDWGDVWSDLVDAWIGDKAFDAASKKVGRAEARWNAKEQKRRDKMRQWCDECGAPPAEDSEDLPAEEIEFGDDEAEVILAFPGGT